MVMQGTLRIRGGPEQKWKTCGAAFIRPDAQHEVDARGRTTLIGFIDAESQCGAALAKQITGDIFGVPVPPTQVARWRSALGPRLSQRRVRHWVRRDLLHERGIVRIHPRVNRVLSYLRERLGREEDFSLKALASVSGLSPSRFMHVFTESVGVPLRPYILWLRLQRGSYELMNGATAIEAAHTAGFSDAAHMTRTFRRMLGTTPIDLALRKSVSKGVSVE